MTQRTHQSETAWSDRALDAHRAASMADEGGVTGARMDLREQLMHTPAEGKRAHAQRRTWLDLAWKAAAATAAGIVVGAVLWHPRSRGD